MYICTSGWAVSGVCAGAAGTPAPDPSLVPGVAVEGAGLGGAARRGVEDGHAAAAGADDVGDEAGAVAADVTQDGALGVDVGELLFHPAPARARERAAAWGTPSAPARGGGGEGEEGLGTRDSLEGLPPPQRQGFGQQRAWEALEAQCVDGDVSQLLGRHLHLPDMGCQGRTGTGMGQGWGWDRDGDAVAPAGAGPLPSGCRSCIQTWGHRERAVSRAMAGTLSPPSQPRSAARRSPLAEEARCGPGEEGELGPAAAADLWAEWGESWGPGGQRLAPPAPAPTFPFRRLLYSSLLCRNFSISALTSTRRTLIISSTVRARLSTG